MKRMVSILMALLIALSLAPVALSEATEPIVLDVYYSAPDVYDGNWKWGDDPISSYITEQTGITLNITYAGSKDHQEFYTMLASGEELPDLLYLGKLEPTLIDEGYALPLNKLADEYYPEFYDLLPYQFADVHTYPDGNIYYYANNYGDAKRLATIPGGAGVKGFSSLGIHYGKWDAMGNPSIETLEDVKNLLLRYKEETGSEYPALIAVNPITADNHYLQELNCSYAGPGFVYPQENGVVTLNVKSAEYKAGAKWVNELYRLGLIQADNFTFTNSVNDESVKAIALAEDPLIVLGQPYMLNKFINMNAGQSVYNLVPSPTGEGVSREDILMNDSGGSNVGKAAWYVMDTTDKPEACIKFLSLMLREDIDRILSHGIEGIHYTRNYDYDDIGICINNPEMVSDVANLSAGELQKKWGYKNGVIGSFSSRYSVQYIERKYIEVDIDGATKGFGDYIHTYFDDCSVPFKTGSLTVNFTDTDELLLYNNVLKAWEESLAGILLSETDAEFEAAYAACLYNMETVGLSKLETLLTERYTHYWNALHEPRNAKWDVFLAQ